ncbi:2-hydroxy-3-oxopropionate reductase [Pseudonocardia nematodicida]|uniref:2-hydroxy-3-oxopropionate reductase n=1 Tax=Pseudonocardia nematodicida TaxID=1206997 RepID=A0ABV1KL36_9PSEU
MTTRSPGCPASTAPPEHPEENRHMSTNGTTVAVIGLGIMGAPMAVNLVKAGYDVIGYNRSAAKVEALVGQGGRGAADVAEAVSAADVVLTMLPDSPDVEAVLLGEDGVLAHARSGALWVDASTIRPDVAVRLAEAAGEKGVRAVDAPVSGGEAGAIEAALSIMVGGAEADVEAARPVLDAVGSTVVHVGPAGAGQTVKAANQLIVAGTIGLVAEALNFVEAHGVDGEAAVQVLAGGLAGNRILDRKATGMLAREFAPGFRVDLHHKDLGIVTSAAREAGVAIPLGSTAAQLMGTLRARGHGSLDHSALMLLIAELSGRS